MYRKNLQGWSKHLDFMILDLISLQAAFILAYMIRFGSVGMMNPYSDRIYRSMALVIAFIDIIVIVFFESMKNVLTRGWGVELGMTIRNICLIELFLTFYLFATQLGGDYSRFIIYLMAVFYVPISYITRIMWKYYLKNRRSPEQLRSLLIITSGDMADEVIENIEVCNNGRFRVAGIALSDWTPQAEAVRNVPVVSDMEHVNEYVCREWIDEVFMILPPTEAYPEELIQNFSEMGVTVHMELLRNARIDTQKHLIEHLGKYTVLTTCINYSGVFSQALKRLMDIAGGLAGCLVTGVLFLILGPMIYMQSPGPIFFSQERIGKNGRRFRMYKFRSMYMDAEERKQELMEENRIKDGFMFKLDFDPRIIGSRKDPDGTIHKGIGNYIRDWSLDEFPQFFNVLKGDMSLVGTRPPTVDEWEKYEFHHRARLAVKPGITGMWQVSGRSEIVDFDKVVQLDTQYIREWNIWLDIKILIKTAMVVLKKDGAM